MSNEIRVPKKDGLKQARNRTKELLEKEPSSELVRIINENNRIISEQVEPSDFEGLDRAALPKPRQPEI